MAFGVFVRSMEFSDGTEVDLTRDTVFVLTGPNNSGKSTFLREVGRAFDRIDRKSAVTGPVLEDLTKQVYGGFVELEAFLKREFDYLEDEDAIRIPSYAKYKIETIRKRFEKGELLPHVEAELVANLSTRNRIDEDSRSDVQRAAAILFNNEPKEIELSQVFRRSFGVDLILCRLPEKSRFYLSKREELPVHEDRLKPAFLGLVKRQPFVSEQGDGLRSFVRIVLTLLYKTRTVALIDEPEMFLHPPQIRQLALAISSDISEGTQVFVATHSEVFLRSIVSYASGRLIVARITRQGKKNSVRLLSSEAVQEFWQDPLLRTSDVLSALFHDIAIICEGDSDAIFFQSVLDANPRADHDPDLRLYHCGGKDRIPKVAKSLEAIGVPVTAIVDLDVLSDRQKFKVLFESMGGIYGTIERQINTIVTNVERRKVQISGRLFSSECAAIAKEVENEAFVPRSARIRLQELLHAVEPWRRIKEDGVRGLVDAESIKAFKEVDRAAKSIGIMINPEGELEGFCRDIPRTNKAAWLTSVLLRDLRNDPELGAARNFVDEVRDAIRNKLRSGSDRTAAD